MREPARRASLKLEGFFVGAGMMDSKDLKILALLQENASLPMSEISRRIHLSQTPCWRRIQKLEEAGVIEKKVAILNPSAVGFGISAFVEIQAPDHSADWHERFSDAILGMPEVMEVHRMAGEVDYLLRVAARSMGDFDAFYRQLVASVPARNVTSRFSMERVKSTTAYPIVPQQQPLR
jgi:Lrp/AsnC family transcriptional regulator